MQVGYNIFSINSKSFDNGLVKFKPYILNRGAGVYIISKGRLRSAFVVSHHAPACILPAP